jgi:hypothetical protein
VENFLAPSIQQLTTDAVMFSFRHGLHWYRIPAVVASLLLLLVSLLGPVPKGDGMGARILRGDLLYLVVVAVFLFGVRWPTLAVGDLEGDESVAVSAAITRYLEPAYGVTIFTGSAGPLLTYPLSALGLLGLRIDYGASKLVSMLLITATSAVFYLALRTFSETRIARVAQLPLLAFYGLASVRWTVSYCSEQWINLLVISMIFFLLRLARQIGRERVNLVGIGLALGLTPLIKWQGMPMAALFVACATAIVWRRWLRQGAAFRALAARLLPLVVPGLAPLLVWCAILWTQGSLGFFFDTYFAALFSQATSRYSTTFLERLVALPGWGISIFPKVELFASMSALFVLPAAIWVFLARRPRRCPPDIALAVLYLVVSVYAALQPGGTFSHYMNLLLQPYAGLTMLVFCHLVKATVRPALAVAIYLGLTLLAPARLYVKDAPVPVRYQPTLNYGGSTDFLRNLQVSGAPLIQWGWVYGYYVNVGLTWGTATGGSHEILEPFFLDQAIFLTDYVESLESGRAPIFVDTATEGSEAYPKRARYGHEQFPEVAEAVRRHYFLWSEFRGARVYLHRGTYAAKAGIEARCTSLPCIPPPRRP